MRVSIGSPRSCSGGHIAHGAEESAGGGVAGERGGFFFVGGLGFEDLGETKIEDLDPVVGGEEDVVGLEVAVDDVAAWAAARPWAIPRLQATAETGGGGPCRRTRRRLSPSRSCGHDVGLVVVDADVVDGEEVGMIERCGGAGLALEAFPPIGAVRDLWRQHLDRHLAAELGVPRRHTSPIPPAPMEVRISNRPSR